MQYKIVLDKALILPAAVERLEMNVNKMCDERLATSGKYLYIQRWKRIFVPVRQW